MGAGRFFLSSNSNISNRFIKVVFVFFLVHFVFIVVYVYKSLVLLSQVLLLYKISFCTFSQSLTKTTDSPTGFPYFTGY